MQKIHWLGAGLSSAPGIFRLAKGKTPLVVWNRSLEKAQKDLAHNELTVDIRQLDWQQLTEAVEEGDVVVSMLPATMHLKVAELCLARKSHFVSSSYIAPEMAALDEQAKSLGLCFVNEVGLDPGIDHLFAHLLVEKYQQSAVFSAQHNHYFRSYCGGFPKVANDFKYKFSWSPLGVLKALKSPAQWLGDGEVKTSNAPWEALSEYTVAFADGEETFQAYPNRDSLPFTRQYHFDENWNVQEFVRGTLRLNHWSTAWQYLFDEIGQLSGEQAESRLQELSNELQEKYSYEENEPDRVVMSVELEVRDNDKTVWHQSYQLNSFGNEQGQAMARLVSVPVSLAIDSVIDGKIGAGVSAAPHQSELINQWLAELDQLGESIRFVDHTL